MTRRTGWVRNRFRSVRVRVTAIATGVVAITLLVGGVALVSVLREGLLNTVAGSGPQRAAEVAAFAGRGPLPNPLPPLDAPRRTLVQVVSPSGQVVAASAGLNALRPLVEPDSRHRQILGDIEGVGRGPWLAEPTPATIGARPETVIVLTSLAEFGEGVHLLEGLLLLGYPVLIGFVAAVVWVVVGRSLRPVEAMRREVAEISASDLHRRVAVLGTHDEVASLAATLNDMLDRLEGSTIRQRQFVADASHELRTPVANIRAAVEVATAHPAVADWATVAADILRQEERMERLTDDLLVLARSDDGRLRPRHEVVELQSLITAELARPVPGGRRLMARGALPVARVIADPDQIGRALTNLIDNGLRHARSTVAVALTRGSRWAEITVTDDGVGIAPADAERVFERFERLDADRGRTSGAAGLGLAIAKALIVANGGSIAVAGSTPGSGATFIVRLPLVLDAVAEPAG